jgi:hypothetical protein
LNSSSKIDRLRISLPPEWRGRETLLVRLIARELGNLPLAAGAELDQMKLSPITHPPGGTTKSLASSIARQIHRQAQIKSSKV